MGQLWCFRTSLPCRKAEGYKKNNSAFKVTNILMAYFAGFAESNEEGTFSVSGSVNGGIFLNTPPPKFGEQKEWREIAEIFQLKENDQKLTCGSNADKTLYYAQLGCSGKHFLLFKNKNIFVANCIDFYFSHGKLETDPFIQKNLVDGVLPLSVLLDFPRLKAVQTSEKDIIESLKFLEHLTICPVGNEKGIRPRKENEIVPPQPQTVDNPPYNYNLTHTYTNVLPQSNGNYFQDYPTLNNMQSFGSTHAGHQQQANPFLPDMAPLYTPPVQPNASATATPANITNMQQLMELMRYINPNSSLQNNAQLLLAQQNDYCNQIPHAAPAASESDQSGVSVTTKSGFNFQFPGSQPLPTINPHQHPNITLRQVITNTDAANGSVDAPQQMAVAQVTTTPNRTNNGPETSKDFSLHRGIQRQAGSGVTGHHYSQKNLARVFEDQPFFGGANN